MSSFTFNGEINGIGNSFGDNNKVKITNSDTRNSIIAKKIKIDLDFLKAKVEKLQMTILGVDANAESMQVWTDYNNLCDTLKELDSLLFKGLNIEIPTPQQAPVIDPITEKMYYAAIFNRNHYQPLLENITKAKRYLKLYSENNSQQTIPAATINTNDIVNEEEGKDVFICHTSADKSAVCEPLIAEFENIGITFWYDKAEIKWGDSVVNKVNEGLRVSKYVILVLSLKFIEKNWPKNELEAVLNMEFSDGKIRALPLMVGSKEEIKLILNKYPLLNSKRFLEWNDGIPNIISSLKDRLT